ncbi:restriction endonuclease [Trichocoleus sp. DQ-A3]|uniref:restriction endonuclease n=1 Tax=Cyanophyceae TaxID=3028117 RepID=UPI001686C046|nr:restriction endonuclease [Coleofasciculus sp. FACHB-125]MBD1901809.1 restriction endonuclease [Coleofasciculus sp. FACHB-125]
MAIPQAKAIAPSLFNYARDGQEHSLRDAIEVLSEKFDLSEDEQKESTSSGGEKLFDNRVRRARDYLKNAGLLEDKRGLVKITELGMEILSTAPSEIDINFLKEFLEDKRPKKTKKDAEKPKQDLGEVLDNSPQKLIDCGYQKIRKDLEIELLKKIKECSAKFFENLVVHLLVRMGYGGSIQDAGKAIGTTGDGGIDGTIKEDKLGLDIVYIQAKRWAEKTIGEPEIRDFVGALHGKKAKKGVFITASKFTTKARNYASSIEYKIVLIDGQQLAEFMIDHNVGVSTVSTYEIKKIDSDYFTDGANLSP